MNISNVVDPSVLFTCRQCGKPNCVNMGDAPYCSYTCRQIHDIFWTNFWNQKRAAAAPRNPGESVNDVYDRELAEGKRLLAELQSAINTTEAANAAHRREVAKEQR